MQNFAISDSLLCLQNNVVLCRVSSLKTANIVKLIEIAFENVLCFCSSCHGVEK